MTVVLTAASRQVEVLEITPSSQTSANAAAVVTGSDADVRAFTTVSYSLSVATNTITYWIYGANRADFVGEAIVSGPTDVVAGASSVYAASPAPYGYYRVKIMSKVGGSHGDVGVYGLAKG